jgi:hypothetical protein
LNAVTEARRTGLFNASGIVPGVICAVLCFGAVVTVDSRSFSERQTFARNRS